MSAAPKRKHPYTRKRTVQQMSEKEREYLQKLEQNKVAFEAWLEKKKYEQAERRKATQKALQLELERQEQRRMTGKLAYQRWLKKKHEEDELLKKEKVIEKEVNRLKSAEREEAKQRVQETYRSWKQKKDVEVKLQKELEREKARASSPAPREPTPTLPGYCSVWSCDEELAEFMVDRVDRGPHSISEVQNHDSDPSNKNFTFSQNSRFPSGRKL